MESEDKVWVAMITLIGFMILMAAICHWSDNAAQIAQLKLAIAQYQQERLTRVK